MAQQRNQRKEVSNDLAEQRFKDRVKSFIFDVIKNPEDVISLEELSQHMRTKYQEYNRVQEIHIRKKCEWHVNKIYSEISFTNIQKKFFKKKDFMPSASRQGLKKEIKEVQQSKSPKTETKASNDDKSSDSEESGDDSDDDESKEDEQSEEESEDNQNNKDDDNEEDESSEGSHEGDEKLISFKSPNLMNQMLPHAQLAAKEQAKQEMLQSLIGKRKSEEQPQSQNGNKRTAGYGGFLKDQKQQEQMKELAEKYLTQSNIQFKDLGGMSEVIKQLKEMIEWPLKYKNIFGYLGVTPPRGILISGPPGTGKTQLALAIAGEYPDVPFYKLNGPEIVSRLSGQSEEKIRNIFQAVRESAPAIIFIDELDSIAGKREDASKDMEVRIVAQLASCLDEIDKEEADIVVIGATTRPESIDQGLRRAGRFEKEIALGVPNEEARIEILKILTRKMRLNPEIDMREIVKMTPGYVGADISTLCKEASIQAVSRIIHEQYKDLEDEKMEDEEDEKELENIFIDLNDFKIASKRVQPSAQREGFSTVPNTTWKDVGALDAVRAELHLSIVEPILHPETFKRIGLSAPAGVLLYGPPGCGKTLVAKAVSNESKANFISIKGPELLNKYVGESEKAVRQLFKRARASAPCVIFFDELDSLCPRRGSENNTSSERVVNQLLTEMDGLDERRDVFVIAATNRPDIIDPAMLRPGRLDKLLYVPLPTNEDRHSILETITRSLPISEDVELQKIANSAQCDGYSGADLSALVREAQLNALKASLFSAGQPQPSDLETQLFITMRDFTVALQKVFPSVSKKDELAYKHLENSLRKSRSHITDGKSTTQ